MKTLVMDTAWKNLVVGLFEDGRQVAGSCEEAFKKQSETLFVRVEQLLDQAGWKLADVDRVVITDGPGSYTGLRIAMTAAKILGSQGGMQVETIPTLALYAGMAPCANVLLDARGGRAYAAHIESGKVLWSGILPLEEIPAFLNDQPGVLYGEGELASQNAHPSDFLGSFQALLEAGRTHPVADIDALVPVYMKESDAYKA